MEIGDKSAVADLDPGLVSAVHERIMEMITVAVDRMKTSATPVPVIVVGGGSILVTGEIEGASEIIKPDHFPVANAIGAAIAQVGGECDRIFSLAELSRDDALDQAKSEASDRAVNAGANAESIEIVDVEEVPLGLPARQRHPHHGQSHRRFGRGLIMRIIDESVLEDLALGAAVLGTGGGGDPYIGKLMARQAIRDYGPVELYTLDELEDDDLVVPTAMMGAPTVMVEKVPNGDDIVNAFLSVGKYIGAPVKATMSIEAGGLNSVVPIYCAARLASPWSIAMAWAAPSPSCKWSRTPSTASRQRPSPCQMNAAIPCSWRPSATCGPRPSPAASL